MVGVAQLVECKIVILVVVGSIPIVHPIFTAPAMQAPLLVAPKILAYPVIAPIIAG